MTRKENLKHLIRRTWHDLSNFFSDIWEDLDVFFIEMIPEFFGNIWWYIKDIDNEIHMFIRAHTPRFMKYLWCRITFHNYIWDYRHEFVWFSCRRCKIAFPTYIGKEKTIRFLWKKIEITKYKGKWKGR